MAGVLGVVPGIMGLLQANEAIKLLLDIGDSLAGRLLLFDALDASFSELRLRRDPACPVCSDAAVAARRPAGRWRWPASASSARSRSVARARGRRGRFVSTVRIPPVLRAQRGRGQAGRHPGATVGELLDGLVTAHPGSVTSCSRPMASSTGSSTSTSTGRTSATSTGRRTPVDPRDELVILPAMAGGALMARSA